MKYYLLMNDRGWPLTFIGSSSVEKFAPYSYPRPFYSLDLATKKQKEWTKRGIKCRVVERD